MEKDLELTEEEKIMMFEISDFNSLKSDFECKCSYSEEEALNAALNVREYDCL